MGSAALLLISILEAVHVIVPGAWLKVITGTRTVPDDYESEALSLWRFSLTPPSTLSIASPSES